MTTASGDKLECEGKGKFTLEIDGKEIEHSIWVAEIEGDGILGYDFLSHHDCWVFIYKRVPTCDMGKFGPKSINCIHFSENNS